MVKWPNGRCLDEDKIHLNLCVFYSIGTLNQHIIAPLTHNMSHRVQWFSRTKENECGELLIHNLVNKMLRTIND